MSSTNQIEESDDEDNSREGGDAKGLRRSQREGKGVILHFSPGDTLGTSEETKSKKIQPLKRKKRDSSIGKDGSNRKVSSTKQADQKEEEEEEPLSSSEDNDTLHLQDGYEDKLKTLEEAMRNLESYVRRDDILREVHLNDQSSRMNLLLIHVVQQDVAFNAGKLSIDTRKYTSKQCEAVLNCVKALHSKYYNVTLVPNDPDAAKRYSSEPAITPLFRMDSEEKEKAPHDEDTKLEQNEDKNESEDKNEFDVVDSIKSDGDSLGTPSSKKYKRSKRFRTSASFKALYCKGCSAELIWMHKKGEKPDILWEPQRINFEHKLTCHHRPENIRGIAQYPVDPSILEAADKLESLARKWYDNVSRNSGNSILVEYTPKDNRFYGLFYLQFGPFTKGLNIYHIIKFVRSKKFLDEVRDFHSFYKNIEVSKEDKEKLMEVVVLFIEDFKFIKRMHSLFRDNINFLGAVGFLAGGKETQRLHYDVKGVPPRCRDPDLPTSILLPIGAKGRSIFFENITDERNKQHVDRGKAVWFDGNVPHAGSISKAKDPLENLALHIHIDSTKYFRQPNILQLASDPNEKAWDSDDEKKPSAKLS